MSEPPERLEWRVGIFALGAALAVAGMMLSSEWLILSAIAVLLAGLLLRFTPRGRPSEPDDCDLDRGS